PPNDLVADPPSCIDEAHRDSQGRAIDPLAAAAGYTIDLRRGTRVENPAQVQPRGCILVLAEEIATCALLDQIRAIKLVVELHYRECAVLLNHAEHLRCLPRAREEAAGRDRKPFRISRAGLGNLADQGYAHRGLLHIGRL